MTNPRATRATELAKQFARLGHDVVLYGVLGSFDYESFEKDNNIKVKNIRKLLFATLNSDGVHSKNILKRALVKLFRKSLEFPSIELMFKIPRIIRGEQDIDLLITIANPHSIHWGAALYKSLSSKQFPKKWLADCGDPFMGNKFEKHYFYFKYLEKHFCRQVDQIIVPIEGAIKGYYSEFHDKISVIPQGFDFKSITLNKDYKKNVIPTFAYSGTFYQDIRDPRELLDYLMSQDLNFKFIIFTNNPHLLGPYIDKLGEKMEINSYIPRFELLHVLSTMDFLVNLENGTQIQSPSKLIDYALTGRPILSVNSKGLNKTKIDQFLRGDYSGGLVVDNIEQYNIQNVVSEFLKCAD